MALPTLRGQVARFNAQGFGFIVENGAGGGGEYFFHASNVSGADAPRAKTPGCNVEFEGRQTDKGRCATWVRVMEDQHPIIMLPDSLDLDLGSDLSSLTLAGSAGMAPGQQAVHSQSYSTSPSHPITPPSPHGGANYGLGWQHPAHQPGHQLPVRREQHALLQHQPGPGGQQRHAPLALQQYCTPLKVPLHQSAMHLELEGQQQQQHALQQLATAGLHQPPTSPMGSTALLSPTSLTPGLPMAVPPVAMHAQRHQHHQLLQQQQQAIDARRYPQQSPPPLHPPSAAEGGGVSPQSQHKPTIMRPTRAPFPSPAPNQMGPRDMHSPPFLSPHAQSPGYQQQHNIFATQSVSSQQQQQYQQPQHSNHHVAASRQQQQQQQQQPANGGSLGSTYPSLQLATSPSAMFHSMPGSLSDGTSFRVHDSSQQLSSCDQQCATPLPPAGAAQRSMMEQHSLSSGSSSVMSNGSGMAPQEGLTSPCVPRKMVLAPGGVATSMGHASNVNSSIASSSAPLMSIFCGCCGEPMRWDLLGERLCEVKAEADAHVLAQSMRGRTVFKAGDTSCCPACRYRVQTNPRSAKCTHCQCVLNDFDPTNAKCTNAACDLARACRDCRDQHSVQPSSECGCPRLTTAIAGHMWGVGGEALQGFVILH